MRILLQFIGQAAGVVLLRKRNGTENLPYKMPLYPLPVILAIAMWLFIFYSTGPGVIKYFVLVFLSGIIVYMVKSRWQQQWPFDKQKK
jgi:amino acid transporter